MRKTLQFRVYLIFLIIIVLSIGGSGLSGFYIFRQWYSNIWYENLHDISQGFSLLISRSFESNSAYTLSSLYGLSQQVNEQYGANLYIVLPDGEIVDQPSDPMVNISEVYELPEVQKAFLGAPANRELYDEETGKNYNFYAVPAISQDSVVGVFLWVTPLEQLSSTLSTFRLFFFVISLVAILIASFFSYLVLDYTFRPLDSLIHRTLRFGTTDNQYLPASNRQDEYGQLENAFDVLAKRLNEQIENLEEKQSMLSAILENMTDGIIIVDKNGIVLMINPAAQAIFKSGDSSAAGHSLTEIVRYHQFVDLWKKSQENGNQQSTTLEIAPSNRFIHGIATPLIQEGKSELCLMAFQDLTRVRKLEMVRRDFISNVSHELRTPLTSLKIIAETLNEGALEDPPAAHNFLRRMEDEIDNLTQMVQELLELSRIESGQVPLEKKRINPLDLIGPAVDRMSMLASRAGLTLQITAVDSLPEVFVDSARLIQVLLNLIHNAIKFTPPGGRITVSAFAETSQVVFVIKDTGVGIEPDALSRVFERFYKADRARSGGGTGLGLSISRHMVELHGGKIWAESLPEKGSTFYFSIPLQPG